MLNGNTPTIDQLRYEVVNSQAKFVAVAAGRRVGKTTMAARKASLCKKRAVIMTPYENQGGIFRNALRDTNCSGEVIVARPHNMRDAYSGGDVLIFDEADYFERRYLIEAIDTLSNRYSQIYFFSTIRDFNAKFKLKLDEYGNITFELDPSSHMLWLLHRTDLDMAKFVIPTPMDDKKIQEFCTYMGEAEFEKECLHPVDNKVRDAIRDAAINKNISNREVEIAYDWPVPNRNGRVYYGAPIPSPGMHTSPFSSDGNQDLPGMNHTIVGGSDYLPSHTHSGYLSTSVQPSVTVLDRAIDPTEYAEYLHRLILRQVQEAVDNGITNGGNQ